MYKFFKYLKYQQKGFSLIELLIVMGIMVIIVPSIMPIYSGLQVSSQLNENISQTIQALRLAREYSRAGLNGSAYGVYFEINSETRDKYILYKGDSYAIRDVDFDRVTIMDDTITLSTTLQENDINFSKWTGKPNTDGQVIFLSDNSNEEIVSVNSEGFVRIER